MPNINNITTEQRNPNTKDIDLVSTNEVIRMINKEDHLVAVAIEKEIDKIEIVVDKVTESFKKGGRLVYIGAGTSGRIGILDASECPPTFGVDPEMVVGLIAGGDYAIKNAVEHAEDNEDAAIIDLENINFSNKDILIGIAASGRTPYVLSGLKYANNIGANTACITTSENSILATTAKYPIEVITGSEALTGSTRMKSGTAQKMVANIITTTAMIKLGKVYENLMIDLKMTNEKLVKRGENIVMDITGANNETAANAIKKYKNVKTAIFGIMANITDEEVINKMLDESEGNLRLAIKKHLE